MDKEDHWQSIYATKDVKDVSWFREHLEPSLELIESANLDRNSSIIDIGGGASTLLDDLLERGYSNITVFDISSAALERTKERLGDTATGATYVIGDITQVALPENEYDLWHDRAVFHFLTNPTERELYLQNLRRALKPDGNLIIATFADDGPLKCSGLEVERYDIEKMKQTIGKEFELLNTFRQQHQTPFDTTQNFLYAYFRRSDTN